MRMLNRDIGRYGRLTALLTADDDDRTVSVQLDDVVLTTEPSASISGPLDAGRLVTADNEGSTVRFHWTTSQLTGWFALLASGLEIRTDEESTVDVSLAISSDASAGGPVVRFSWTSASDGAALVYGGTTINSLPAGIRTIELTSPGESPRGRILIDDGAATYDTDSDLSWLANGWRELHPADPPRSPPGQTRPAVVKATVDATGASGPITVVRFDPLGVTAPSYLPDFTSHVTYAAPAAKVKVPILDVPAQKQSIRWGGSSGQFTVTVETDGLTRELRSNTLVDAEHLSLQVDHALGVPLDTADGTPLTFSYAGFEFTIDGKGGPPLVLRTANGDHRVTLGPRADAEMAYRELSEEPLRFAISDFTIGSAGLQVDATVLDDPVTLHGLGTSFRFTEGTVLIREGEMLDFSLAGSGPLPPDLVGEAMADIAIQFKQMTDDGTRRATPVAAGATLGTDGTLLGVVVPFRYDLLGIGLGFEKTDVNGVDVRYDFYFTLTGTATFAPPPGLPSDDPLSMLDAATIELNAAPLAADLSRLARAMSFRIELAEPVGFKFLRAFSMEIQEIALYGQVDAFDGAPGIELAGQVKFAEGEGDKKRSAESRHRLVIGPPKPGTVIPRIQLKELGLTIQKGDAFTLDATVNFVDKADDTGVVTKGFTGEGTLEIQGLPSLAVAVGFMTINRPAEGNHPAETVKAWFLAINVGHLTVKIPYIEIYLREVGLGFGYRYTLTSIAAADAAGGLAEMIAALREASRTQGDLATVDAWSVSLEPRGTDPRWTIAMRALFSQMASPKSTPLKIDKKSEEKLANVFLFDVLAAVRSDLTILMTARLWLNTNYIDYDNDTDGTIKGKPLASGFAIVQPAHQRFLAQVSTNPDGHMGSRPPLPAPLVGALRSVQVAATVMVEPNLVHAELGWPNGLRYSMEIPGVVDVSVEAGVIYRIARRADGGADLVLGISYKAQAAMEFRHSVDLGVAGASIVAKASASFGARFIAAAELGPDNNRLDVYGGLSVDLRVRVSISAWIGVDLGFVEIKKHFSMSLELGFSASLEFGMRVQPNATDLGFAGRGTLMVRAFGRRFEFGVAISSSPEIVNHARTVTAKYLSLGLEAGDGDLALAESTEPAPTPVTDPAPGTDTDRGAGTDTGAGTGSSTEEDPDSSNPEPGIADGPGRPEPVDLSLLEPGKPLPTSTESPPVAANWMALALPSVQDQHGHEAEGEDEDEGYTYLVLYPGDGPGFVPVPPSTVGAQNDFRLVIDPARLRNLERYDPTDGWVAVDGEASWKIRWRNEEATDEKKKRGLEDYVAAAFVNGPDSAGLSDPVPLPDDDELTPVSDRRVGDPSASDYEAAVRGTLDQFRRSPHFKPDLTSDYELHLRSAFSPERDVYESPEVRNARQLRSMMVEQMVGDARDYAALPVDDPETGETAPDPDPRGGSPVFLFGLVLRVTGGDWLDSNIDGLRLAQRLGPSGEPSDPTEVSLFNPGRIGFVDDPPEFEEVVQFADEAMVAFDWKLTWSPASAGGDGPAHSVEHYLAHYEVRRRTLAGGEDQVLVTTVKPADALVHTGRESAASNQAGRENFALVRRRFEFVDNFDEESPDEIELLRPTGRAYVYTITPIDVNGGRGRPITLTATRVPSRPPVAPADVDLAVDYTLTAADFEPADLAPAAPTDGSEPESPPGRPKPVKPTGLRVAWTEPAVPAGRRAAPTFQRHLVFRRRSTLPVGSYGLDTATNGAERTDLPSSNAGLRRDDLIVKLDIGDTEAEPRDGGRRWSLSVDVETLAEAGVYPHGPWQPDAWQVFVRTVSEADVPSALVPARIVLHFEADPTVTSLNGSAAGVEERQPAELEWLTGPLGLRPLPADDTVADAGVLHVPQVDEGHVVFRPHPAGVRAVRVRWNQAPSSAKGHDPALTAGFHVFRLDIDAHSDATFRDPDRIGQVARLLDEVRLQPVADVDREPRDTRTPGIWESWAPEPGPLPPELGWPSPDLTGVATAVGDHGILHPLLAAIVKQLTATGDVVVGADTGRPVTDKLAERFLDTFGPDADPYGWSLLQFLGLSMTVGLRDRYTNEVLAGADVLARISSALDELLAEEDELADRMLNHVRVDRLYQPAAASSLEPDPVPDSALLAIVRVSLMPVAADATRLEDPNVTVLQELVDRATSETGAFKLPALPVAFSARFAPPEPPVPDPAAADSPVPDPSEGETPPETIDYTTAAPRLSAPTRAVPDLSGRVHYDDRITDGYAHAYRYYVRPYGRYDRLWHGLAQSPVFAPLRPAPESNERPDALSVPARLAVDRPLDVTDPDPAAARKVADVGADAVLDRVAKLAPPVILASNRIDVAGPGPTWEIVMAAHAEQWLSEQNRTVARRLDYRQVMFTVLRSFRYADAARPVGWKPETTPLELPTGVTAELPALPVAPSDPPPDLTEEERAQAERKTRADATQAAADRAVLGRVGDPARNAEVVQITSLPFYYEHRFVAVAQSSLVRSDPVSVAHREFGYRSSAAVGTVTAEGTGSEKRRRTITVALARLWDSLTEDSQTRWPGEKPPADREPGLDEPLDIAPARLVSEVPDPEVAYDIVFQRSGTVQPVATIKLVPPEGDGDPTWELEPVGSLFEMERVGDDSFVVPHGTRPVGLAFTIRYVGEPLFVPPEAIPALPEVAVPTLPALLPAVIVAVPRPPVLVAAGAVESLSDDDLHNAIPAFEEAHEALEWLAPESESLSAEEGESPYLSTALDPTRPDPRVPELRATVEDADIVAVRLVMPLSPESRMALDNRAHGSRWDTIVDDLVTTELTAPMLPSPADTMPATMQLDGDFLAWPIVADGPAWTELDAWGERIQAIRDAAAPQLENLDPSLSAWSEVLDRMDECRAIWSRIIDEVLEQHDEDYVLDPIPVDPDHSRWYVRRPATLFDDAVKLEETSIRLVELLDAPTHSEILEATEHLDPAIGHSTMLLWERLIDGVSIAVEPALPVVPPGRPEALAATRLLATDVMSLSDRDELIAEFNSDQPTREDTLGKAAAQALFQRAMWSDLAGGTLLLRTRRGTAPPTGLTDLVASTPTRKIPAPTGTDQTEEDSND